MKDLKHHNIVELIGICLDSPDGFPLMVLPLFLNENLKTYLQKSRGFSPRVDFIPVVGINTCVAILCLNMPQKRCVFIMLMIIMHLITGVVHLYPHYNVSGDCTRYELLGREKFCPQRPCCKKLHVSKLNTSYVNIYASFPLYSGLTLTFPLKLETLDSQEKHTNPTITQPHIQKSVQ